MKSLPTSSLIIATYKWPQALRCCLKSALNLTTMPDEIIVADDGSGKATGDVIREFQAKSPVPVIHVWHEDRGFRLAEIRNKAICKASGTYILQIDGDIILHPYFISDHLNAAEQSTFLIGSRVLLDSKHSLQAQKQELTSFKWYAKGITNRLNAMRIPWLSSLLKAPTRDANKAAYSARGCNMSFWKNDLIKVNGYDETMVGWGREDSELSARLVNVGLTKARLKFGGIQFHQFHKEHSREGVNVNDAILEETIRKNKIYCESGLSNHC